MLMFAALFAVIESKSDHFWLVTRLHMQLALTCPLTKSLYGRAVKGKEALLLQDQLVQPAFEHPARQ